MASKHALAKARMQQRWLNLLMLVSVCVYVGLIIGQAFD
jgi:hypothetical protein